MKFQRVRDRRGHPVNYGLLAMDKEMQGESPEQTRTEYVEEGMGKAAARARTAQCNVIDGIVLKE